LPKTNKTPPRLTDRELVERMCLNSPKLADEVYDIAKMQLANEEKREANFGAKAVSLLSVTGLSLTVAFTFGGVLLQRPEYLAALGGWRHVVVAGYALALISGMAASWFALRALVIRSDYRAIAERDVFGDELAEADTKGDAGPVAYRRFLAVHFWLIYQNNWSIHEEKARHVQRGQWCFFAFLFLLLPIGGAMTYSLNVAKDSPARPVPVTCVVRVEESKPAAPPPAPAPTAPPAKPAPTRVPSSGEFVQGNTKIGERTVPPAKRKP
jgi:hypothetical protein